VERRRGKGEGKREKEGEGKEGREGEGRGREWTPQGFSEMTLLH